MKNQVLMDLSTILSAANNPSPVLKLIDLSRLVEAIALYDDILYYGDPQMLYSGTKGHLFEDGLPSEVKEIFKRGPDVTDFGVKTLPVSIYDTKTGEKIANGERIFPSDSTPKYLDDKGSPFILEMLQKIDFRLFSYATHYKQELSEEEKFSFVRASVLRSYYYLLTATKLKIPYNPQLFRVPIVRFLPLSHRISLSSAIYRQFEDKLMYHITKEAGVNRIEVAVPMLFTFIIREAKNKDPYDILKIAIQLRKSNEMSRIREVFCRLNDSIDCFDLHQIGEKIQMLDEENETLIKKLSGVQQSKLEYKIKLWDIPDISQDFKILIQKLRDRNIQNSTVLLGGISEYGSQVLSLKSDVERVLDIRLSKNDEDFLLSLSKTRESR